MSTAEYQRDRYQAIKAGVWRPTREHGATPKARVSPTVRDLAWAAGFLEGEGTFHKNQLVGVVQKNREPLNRMQMLFGGSLKSTTRLRNVDYPIWRVTGARARGVMLTLFPFMSRRRKDQIIVALRG